MTKSNDQFINESNHKDKDKNKNKDYNQCVELKNIQYKTMLEKGNDNLILPKNNSNFKNLQSIEDILDKERETFKNENWNRLNNTIKRSKILNYIDSFIADNNLPLQDKNNLLDSILKYLDKNMLQKAKDVTYDKDTGVILDIPALEYNITNKRFTLKKNLKNTTTNKISKTRKKTDKSIKHSLNID